MRIDLSLRARSWDRSLSCKVFRAITRFSEFFMWRAWWFFNCRSIPLEVIFLCMNVSACSKFPFMTWTQIPRHCWRDELSELMAELGRFSLLTRWLAAVFISGFFFWGFLVLGLPVECRKLMRLDEMGLPVEKNLEISYNTLNFILFMLYRCFFYYYSFSLCTFPF